MPTNIPYAQSPNYVKHINSRIARDAKVAATLLGMSMKDFIAQAIIEKIRNSANLNQEQFYCNQPVTQQQP